MGWFSLLISSLHSLWRFHDSISPSLFLLTWVRKSGLHFLCSDWEFPWYLQWNPEERGKRNSIRIALPTVFLDKDSSSLLNHCCLYPHSYHATMVLLGSRVGRNRKKASIPPTFHSIWNSNSSLRSRRQKLFSFSTYCILLGSACFRVKMILEDDPGGREDGKVASQCHMTSHCGLFSNLSAIVYFSGCSNSSFILRSRV